MYLDGRLVAPHIAATSLQIRTFIESAPSGLRGADPSALRASLPARLSAAAAATSTDWKVRAAGAAARRRPPVRHLPPLHAEA